MNPKNILSGLALIIGAWFIWRLMDRAAANVGARDRAIEDELAAFGSRN